MVPFVPLVLIAQSLYTWTASAWTPATVAEAIPDAAADIGLRREEFLGSLILLLN